MSKTTKGHDDITITRVADTPYPSDDTTRRERACLIVLLGRDVGKMYRLREGITILGRSRSVDVRLNDDSVSRRHARLRLSGANAHIEDLGSSNGTAVNGARVKTTTLNDGDKIRIGEATVLKFTFHDRLDENFQRQMYDAALRDPLTRAHNKKYFLDQLSSELAYARRHRTSLSMVMFDLDHFKHINDDYGHVAGDHVLKDVVTVVRKMLRAEDVFARYGGEEFAIVLRGTTIADAGVLAERLRAKIDDYYFESGRVRLPVSVSVGVAQFDTSHLSPQDLVAAADAALYAAKSAGRNCVILGPPGD